jgi:O-antigen/teichoic acid export membrane protein
MVQQIVRGLIVAALRPQVLRLGLDRRSAGELWHVGRQVMASGIANTAYANLDKSVVARIAGPVALGGYSLAVAITSVPFFLIGVGSVRVLLPTYRRLLDEGRRLADALSTAFAVVAWAAALPLGFVAVAGPAAVGVALGDKWSAFDATLRVLALYGWIRTVAATAEPVLIASGHARDQRRVLQCQLVLMLVLVVPRLSLPAPSEPAVAVTTALALGTCLLFRLALRVAGVPARKLWRTASKRWSVALSQERSA